MSAPDDEMAGSRSSLLRSRWLRVIASVVLMAALGIVALLIVRNWQAVRAYNWDLRWWPLLAALPLYPLSSGLAVHVWVSMLRSLGADVYFGESFYALTVSNLARKLPTPLWFFGGRILLSRDQGVPEAASSAGLVLEQMLSLLAAIMVAALAGIVGGVTLTSGALRWALISTAGLCVALLLRPGVLLRAINSIMRRLGSQQRVVSVARPEDMARWLLEYSVAWIVGGIIYCLICLSIYPLPLANWLALISLSALGGAISFLSLVLPAGLGLREAATASMLATFVPVPVAVAVPLISRVWYLANELLWAGVVAVLHTAANRHAV